MRKSCFCNFLKLQMLHAILRENCYFLKNVPDLKERTHYEEKNLFEGINSIFNFVIVGKRRTKFKLLQFSKIQSKPWISDLCHLYKCILLYSYKKFKERNWSRFCESFENVRGDSCKVPPKMNECFQNRCCYRCKAVTGASVTGSKVTGTGILGIWRETVKDLIGSKDVIDAMREGILLKPVLNPITVASVKGKRDACTW